MQQWCLDVMGVTQTHPRKQGWQFAPSYKALESRAVHVEGKAMLVPEEAELLCAPRGQPSPSFSGGAISGSGSLEAGYCGMPSHLQRAVQ